MILIRKQTEIQMLIIGYHLPLNIFMDTATWLAINKPFWNFRWRASRFTVIFIVQPSIYGVKNFNFVGSFICQRTACLHRVE